MSYADVRHWYEDPPDEQDYINAEKARALATHRLCDCGKDDCRACSGGLALCTVCGGAEAAMPYECPGVRLSGDDLDAVQNRKRDYIAGEWRPLCGGCFQAIEPDTCGCGDSRKAHENGFAFNHPFIALGCGCHKAKEQS
jgi:hypothetical protein